MTIQEAKELQEVKSRAENNTHQIDEVNCPPSKASGISSLISFKGTCFSGGT